MKLSKIDCNKDMKKSAIEQLDRVKALNPESVVIFAFNNGSVETFISYGTDRLKAIGAIEVAKMELWGPLE